jgi:transcriptional regulator with XRE-family HTH domain
VPQDGFRTSVLPSDVARANAGLQAANGAASEPHVVLCFQYKPHMVQLRQRLARFIREKRGEMPQRDFARKIGVAQSTIMRIENLDQNVTIDTLESLCKVFHADVADLFPRLDTSRDYLTRPPVGLIRPGQGSPLPLIHEAGIGTGRNAGPQAKTLARKPGASAGKPRPPAGRKRSPSTDDTP